MKEKGIRKKKLFGGIFYSSTFKFIFSNKTKLQLFG